MTGDDLPDLSFTADADIAASADDEFAQWSGVWADTQGQPASCRDFFMESELVSAADEDGAVGQLIPIARFSYRDDPDGFDGYIEVIARVFDGPVDGERVISEYRDAVAGCPDGYEADEWSAETVSAVAVGADIPAGVSAFAAEEKSGPAGYSYTVLSVRNVAVSVEAWQVEGEALTSEDLDRAVRVVAEHLSALTGI